MGTIFSQCCAEKRSNDDAQEVKKEENNLKEVKSPSKKIKEEAQTPFLINCQSFQKFFEGDFYQLYQVCQDEKQTFTKYSEMKDQQKEMKELGAIYRCVKHLESGNLYTMQSFDKSNEVEQNNHVRWIQQSSHHGIARFEHVFNDKKYFIHILEYMEGPTLKQYMNSKLAQSESKETLIKDLSSFATQILQALVMLHERQVVLLGIDPESIILVQKNQLQCGKIVNMKNTQKQSQLNNLFKKLNVNKQYYCAPEIANMQNLTDSVDIWAFGLLLGDILCASQKFSNGIQEILNSKAKPEVQERKINDLITSITSNYKLTSFLKEVLNLNPQKRLNAQQALKHMFLKQQEKLGKKESQIVKNNFSKYLGLNEVQKFLFQNIVMENLQNEKKIELLSIYKKIDKNNDGKIQIDEMEQVLKESNPKISEAKVKKTAKMYFKGLDQDQSGALMFKDLSKEQVEEACKKLFDFLDQVSFNFRIIMELSTYKTQRKHFRRTINQMNNDFCNS